MRIHALPALIMALCIGFGGYWLTPKVIAYHNTAWPVLTVSGLTRITFRAADETFYVVPVASLAKESTDCEDNAGKRVKNAIMPVSQSSSGAPQWALCNEHGVLSLASLSRISELLQHIGKHEPLYSIEAYDKDRARLYGLDADAAEHSAHFDGNVHWTLFAGKKAEHKNTCYARSKAAEDTVCVVDASFATLLALKQEEYADTRLLFADKKNISRIRVSLPQETWEAVRDDDNAFSLVFVHKNVAPAIQGAEVAHVAFAPKANAEMLFANAKEDMLARKNDADSKNDVRISAPLFDFYLHSLCAVKGTFACPSSDVAARIACHDILPMARIELWSENGKEEILLYQNEKEEGGEKMGEIICQSSRQPALLCVEEKTATSLSPTAFFLQDRRVLSLPSHIVSQQVQIWGKQQFAVHSLVHENGVWHDEVSKSSLQGIDMLLYALGEVQYMAEPQKTISQKARLWLNWKLFPQESTENSVVLRIFYDTALPKGLCWLYNEAVGLYYPVSTQIIDDILGRLPVAKTAG